MFWAPTSTRQPFTALTAAGSRGYGGHSTTSQVRVLGSMGLSSSTKPFTWEGTMFIFQFPAIMVLR